jgi:hypothetical protein
MGPHHAPDKLEALLVLALKTEPDMVFAAPDISTVNGFAFCFVDPCLVIRGD